LYDPRSVAGRPGLTGGKRIAVTIHKKLLIISLLYFAEGFPYGIIEQAFPIYFRENKMSLEHVGLLSLVSLPYALKFLWAPAVDFLGKRRYWICSVQFLLAACLWFVVSLDPKAPSALLWACLGALAVLSATQDIAIDAYSIEMLDASEMGIANGFRQAAYRVALVMAGGIFVAAGGWMGWEAAFRTASGLMLCCGIAALTLPPIEVQRPTFSLSSLAAILKDLLGRPGVVPVAAFILLYKLGDMSMGPMVRPFWLDRGLTLEEIGLITGSLGVIASIAGGLAGGVFMVRFGIFHGLWFLGLWQAVSNLTYVWVAAFPESGNFGIYVASGIESFCAGLGTSAFLAFLMSICSKQYSATQYAILSALFRVPGILVGAPSGWAVAKMGFAEYFALTFVLALPAFAFLGYVRRWIPEEHS
jgi:MFS transporter, PAT family, beta-lactamase induction signal transducer AmpG